MRKRVLAAAILAATTGQAAQTAQAGPFDGLYIPRGKGGVHWNCIYNGHEAGAIWIEDNRYHPIEDPTCRLTNPVQVRDMPAVLFDLVCDGDNAVANERVMFVRQADGMFEVRERWMVDWERCGEE